jgi:hypothetical protein
MNDSLFQIFWKIILNLSLIPSPFFFSFLIRSKWFKTSWVHQLGFYKTSLLHFRSKNVMIQDSKLKILIYFNLPIIEDWTPLHLIFFP